MTAPTGWLPRLFRVAPWIVIGLILAAMFARERVHVVTKRELIIVRAERDAVVGAVGDATGERVTPVTAVRAAVTLRRDRDAARVALTRQQDATRLATARATAADLARIRVVETRYARITQETSIALVPRLAAARADAAAYARRVRVAAGVAAAADSGRGREPDLPEPTLAAGRVAASGGAAVLDADLRICATNTVLAESWREWWGRVTATKP